MVQTARIAYFKHRYSNITTLELYDFVMVTFFSDGIFKVLYEYLISFL